MAFVKSESVGTSPLFLGSPAPSRASAVPPEPMDVDIQATPAAGSDNGQETTTGYLHQLTSAISAEVLDKAMEIGVEILNGLEDPLEFATLCDNSTQAPEWIRAIKNLKQRTRPTRTIVGVVGNTGAGKSSVISAVLDEERLLPTNCMRACTASPTEIAYNYSDDPNDAYRAEIEFLAAEEWTKELEALFADLLDGNGDVSRDCTNSDTDAGVAYAKIKAVYPKKTREMIANSTVEGLANEIVVRSVLGTSKKLRAQTASSIFSQLKTYVDSRDKNTEKRIEYWPLIKVVRIYVKSDALATGACLVDLPGVQDSNAARATVAANYMKACTGLWIVAPITRAVDNKTAKSLLGDSFRRQLKYDGTYSAVTFICSKTDDISVTEAAESLGIDDRVSEYWENILRLERELMSLNDEMAHLMDLKDAYIETLEELDETWDKWESFSRKLSDGKTVYAPSANSSFDNKKRKRQSRHTASRKSRKSTDSDFDNVESSSDSGFDSDSSEKENGQPIDNEARSILTEEAIDTKLGELKSRKKSLRDDRKEIEARIAIIREDMKKFKEDKRTHEAKVKSICIQGRNEYSRAAIKQDFAMGIKELDQEAAAEEDEENFDPEVDIRDYDAVAESLPVFCVSSRAFQKLSGHLQKDGFRGDGFVALEDTEIPQLQAHAKKLTEAGRVANHRGFLHDLINLLNSMKLWANNAEGVSNLSEQEKRAEEVRLRARLDELEKELESAVKECILSIERALCADIYDNFDRSIPVAAQAAFPTADGWGAAKTQGGLLWSTYKATTRRWGVFSGASGTRDFNQELFEPISKQLAGGWERAFQRQLPSVLNTCTEVLKKLVKDFHEDAVRGAAERGITYTGITMLEQQLQSNIHLINALPAAVFGIAQALQRTANRNFTPVIQEKMMPAYEVSNNERGPGSYARMKAAVTGHVHNQCGTMFRDATNTVQNELQAMCREIEISMTSHVRQLFDRISRDYLTVLVGIDSQKTNFGLSRTNRLLRAEMQILLAKADNRFAELVPVPTISAGNRHTISSATAEYNGMAGRSPCPHNKSEQSSTPADNKGQRNVPAFLDRRTQNDEFNIGYTSTFRRTTSLKGQSHENVVATGKDSLGWDEDLANPFASDGE